MRLTREADDATLLARAAALVDEMRRQGTTTVEIKSGYGLTVHDEERALRLARELTPETTFLGAHVVPVEFADDPDAYVDLVTGPMLDACAPYARWIDVFCETGAFTVEQSRRILEAGAARGLGLRVHAGQLGESDGVRLAVELGAASVDHGTFLSDADVEALAGSQTVATLLPGVEFSTRQPYPSGRRAARRRRHRRHRHRLQPGLVVHLVHPVLHRPRGARDGDDAARGPARRDRRRRPRPAARRRRPPSGRGDRRARATRRAERDAPGLSAGGAVGAAGGGLSGDLGPRVNGS